MHPLVIIAVVIFVLGVVLMSRIMLGPLLLLLTMPALFLTLNRVRVWAMTTATTARATLRGSLLHLRPAGALLQRGRGGRQRLWHRNIFHAATGTRGARRECIVNLGNPLIPRN